MRNVDRRQVTDAQRVLAGEAVEPDFKERARSRMAIGGSNKGGAIAPPLTTPLRARDEVAKAVGIGHGSTYERQKDLVNEARDLFGTDTVNERIATGTQTTRTARPDEFRNGPLQCSVDVTALLLGHPTRSVVSLTQEPCRRSADTRASNRSPW